MLDFASNFVYKYSALALNKSVLNCLLHLKPNCTKELTQKLVRDKLTFAVMPLTEEKRFKH
jgi:hypothetical protein